MPHAINTEITNLIKYSRIIFKNTEITNFKNLIQCIDDSLNNIQCLLFFDFLFEGISSIKLRLLMIKNIGINRFVKLFDNFIDKNINELSYILNNILKVGIETNNECYLYCLLDSIGNFKLIKLIKSIYNQNTKLNLCKQIFNVYLYNNQIKVFLNLLNALDIKELNLIQNNINVNVNISDNFSFVNRNKFLHHLHIIGDFNYQLFKDEIKQNNINYIYLSNVIEKILNNSNGIYTNKLEFKASLLDSCVQGIISIISELKSIKDIKVSLEEKMCTKLLNSLFKKISDSELEELYNTEYVKTSLQISIECGQENVEQLKTIYLKKSINKDDILYNYTNTVGTFIETEMINRDFKKTKKLLDTNSILSLILNKATQATTDCNFLQQTAPKKNLYFH